MSAALAGHSSVSARHRGQQRTWYPLDNSAKIFPAIKTGKVSAVFRLSIHLREVVDPAVLQQALIDILPRFPHFAMKLKPGLFWYYLEPNPAGPLVYEDTRNPCRRLYRKDNQGFLFRVVYYERRIALEVFHSLADGTGSMAFLETLAARYLTLRYNLAIPCSDSILDIHQPPAEEELEDSYRRYARPIHAFSRRRPRAYHLDGKLEAMGRINVISARIPVQALHDLAARYGATINDLLVASYIHAYCRLQQAGENRPHRPVVIAVPVNMRRFYASRTLRNFFLRVHPQINQVYGSFTFTEIINEVHHSMKIMTLEKYLNAQMYANVRAEKMLGARLVPLLLKNQILRLAYLFFGDSRTTSTLTNVGAVHLPEIMQTYVEGFDAMMGPSLANWVNCAIISYQGNLVMTFTRRIREPLVERLVLTHLVQLGIPVQVSSNQDAGPVRGKSGANRDSVTQET